ncbi:nucleotide exchange factor GrpE [Candidatus Kaiserbacteria bacterium RIFCSPHIGHO2_12_FULL_53_13]|uniref:Protein GrpE n=1 Tax=Candidatus Kaiserbacteria bacterium RIFCSPHIGHO2_12_FULL_53_13 TaxID=1798502 RepID=A0A1F6E7R1_9BACT|nr:MAG: nucleotide exchange factor GrpE [Candidatus Kaiserbacteria bacterium RIFCSPHIGHO2_12_FULL_53_13]OGG74435.1 MAG: nucleotide exchange factor GrpE [Candidatus Kaiserbacteria bacterium RIFCSPLOWO2_01_FULL_52_36]
MISNEHADEKDTEPREDTVQDINFEPEEELGNIGSLQAKLKKIKDDLDVCKKERVEYLDGWQRCKADSINSRKEALSMAERAGNRTRDALIEDIIPALDSFDMATASDTWSKMDPNWRKGMENVRSQLTAALEKHGVRAFGESGDAFDPAAHEAVQEIEEAGEPGKIARVLRRGYRIDERIVRPAHVAININREQNE